MAVIELSVEADNVLGLSSILSIWIHICNGSLTLIEFATSFSPLPPKKPQQRIVRPSQQVRQHPSLLCYQLSEKPAPLQTPTLLIFATQLVSIWAHYGATLIVSTAIFTAETLRKYSPSAQGLKMVYSQGSSYKSRL